jgi:hypothetical protein
MYNKGERGFENSTGKHHEEGTLYTLYKDVAMATKGLSIC